MQLRATQAGRQTWARRRARLEPYVWIAPGLLLYAVFILVAVIVNFWMSFVRWDGIAAPVGVGFQNFANVFHDSRFWSAMKIGAEFSFFSVLLKLALSLLLAVLLNRAWPGRGAMRVIIFLPCVIAPVLIGMMFNYVLDYSQGLVNGILGGVGLDALKRNWLGQADTALGSHRSASTPGAGPASRPSSCWPGCKAFPPTSMKWPRSTAPMPGPRSGASPCRCSLPVIMVVVDPLRRGRLQSVRPPLCDDCGRAKPGAPIRPSSRSTRRSSSSTSSATARPRASCSSSSSGLWCWSRSGSCAAKGISSHGTRRYLPAQEPFRHRASRGRLHQKATGSALGRRHDKASVYLLLAGHDRRDRLSPGDAAHRFVQDPV